MLLRHGMMLLERASAAASRCPIAGYNPCGQGLPSNFCCSPDTTCIALASNTTALCCPRGQSCAAIAPTTCDVDMMNVAIHPDSAILTTSLDGELSSCGESACCPLGYDCASSGGSPPRCVMEKNQVVSSTVVSHVSRTGVVDGSFTSTATSTPTDSTATVDATADVTADPSADSPADSTAASTSSTTSPSTTDTTTWDTTKPKSGGTTARNAGIMAGSAVAGLVLLVGVALIYWNKRRQSRNQRRSKPTAEPPSHEDQYQHQDRYQDQRVHQYPRHYKPPAYLLPPKTTDPMKELPPHPLAPAFGTTLTNSPAYVSVAALPELEGTQNHPQPSTQSPVELPASPVSFTMWSRQEEERRRNTQLFKPPRASFVPWSRFSARQRGETYDDTRG